MRNAGLEETQAGIKIAGRNLNNLRYADDSTLKAESEEELKNLLMKVKEESENFGLKLSIQKTKIMASHPIISWQIEGEKVETLTDFIFLYSSPKECSNYHTTAFISHASKVMLKILQARLQQYVNHVLPDVQNTFRKGRGSRDQIANIHWIIEKAREFQKNIYFCFTDYAKAFDHVDHSKLWKIMKEMGIPDHLTCLL